MLDDILILIGNLIDITPEGQLVIDSEVEEVKFYEGAGAALSHTRNKEGGYVEYKYNETKKRNAAKKRQTELYSTFRNLVSQVHQDIFIIGRI